MTDDNERDFTDEGDIPGLGNKDHYDSNNVNRTVSPTGDGRPNEHTDPNNGEGKADDFVSVEAQTNILQEAGPSENQSSRDNPTKEAVVTDSEIQSQDTQGMLDAAKKRAREAEFKLRKSENDLIAERTRANEAESEVHYWLSKVKEWEAWEEQQRQAQQSSKTNRKTAATVADLKKQLKDTKHKLDASKAKLDASKADASVVECRLGKTEKELMKALQRAKDAEDERARLFKMLNGATVLRDNRSPPGSFPDGDRITKMATKAAILAWEYLMDISDFLEIDPLHAATSGLWRAVDFAEDAVMERVEKKTKHLAEFTEGEIPPEETLGHLFWKSTMQHVMKQKLDKVYDSFFAEWVSSDENLKVIVDMDEKHKEDLEGRNIGTFMELHFKLRLACRFSDPECFLWPAIGTTVAFSSKHHNQQKTPDRSKRKAKAGESVHVVYPGLYFRDPQEPDCEPVVRAMVAVL